MVATDPVAGVTKPEKVLATITGTGNKTLIDLTIDTDGTTGNQHTTLTATNNHPFWAPNLATWLNADDINPGTQLLTATSQHVQVEAIHTRQQPATIHNLTVANLHTYYVLAGDTPVLVHNSGPNCKVPLGGKNGDSRGKEDFHGSEYSLDEIIEFINGHTGDGNPAKGRPSMREVENALRQVGPELLEDQNSSKFDLGGVRVIVNWDMPWRSTAFYLEVW